LLSLFFPRQNFFCILEKGNLSEQKKIGGKKINLAKTILPIFNFQFILCFRNTLTWRNKNFSDFRYVGELMPSKKFTMQIPYQTEMFEWFVFEFKKNQQFINFFYKF
jgi:hypothetical protein